MMMMMIEHKEPLPSKHIQQCDSWEKSKSVSKIY